MINNIGYIPCIDTIAKNDQLLTKQIKELAANSTDTKLGELVLKLLEYNELKINAESEDNSMDAVLKVQAFGDMLIKEIDKENA